MVDESSRLLIFSKAPVAGRVKTRLIPLLGPECAARLQAELFDHCLEKLLKADIAPLELWCAPDCSHPVFQNRNQPCYQQQGDDLGERMEHALASALSRCDYAFLLGTDSPALTPEVISEGLERLRSGYDAVVVPAEDGGYVAIGVRRVEQMLFSDIEWGSDKVFRQTAERLDRLGWKWQTLQSCWDVDRPEDYLRYRRFLADRQNNG